MPIIVLTMNYVYIEYYKNVNCLCKFYCIKRETPMIMIKYF